MCCIRCLNLDALWGKETSTVDSTARAVRQTVHLLKPLGIQPQYPALGPWPFPSRGLFGIRCVYRNASQVSRTWPL